MRIISIYLTTLIFLICANSWAKIYSSKEIIDFTGYFDLDKTSQNKDVLYAFQKYRANSSSVINSALRTNQKKSSDKINKIIASIDSFFETPFGILPDDLVVFRGQGMKYRGQIYENGDEFLVKNYWSTSLSIDIANMFATGVYAQYAQAMIKPSNTVIYVIYSSGSRAVRWLGGGEYEVLFDRNLKYKVMYTRKSPKYHRSISIQLLQHCIEQVCDSEVLSEYQYLINYIDSL